MPWDAVGDGLRKIAMRVDDGDAMPRHDVEHGEIEEHGALAAAGLADDVDVPRAFFRREAKRLAARIRRDMQGVVFHTSEAASGARPDAKAAGVTVMRPTCGGRARP